MSAPTYVLNDDSAHVITLFRNDERVSHVFRDHWLEFREIAENGMGPLYYIIAHDYGTGEETLLSLKDQKEYDILEREINRNADEVANFKKSVEGYKNRNVGKDFVKAVEALRVQRFCDEWLKEQEVALDVKPVEVGFFGVEPRVSDKDLKELCMKALEAKTDPLKLKELEERFPGATMVLTAGSNIRVVKYVYEDLYVDESINHNIACDSTGSLPAADFATLGVVAGQRPQLMAEWRGMYIDLSHLF